MTLAIYCAGGLGKETLELAKAINRWDNYLFVDDVTDAVEYRGMPVRRFESLEDCGSNLEFIIANGEPAARKVLYEKIKAAGYPLATLVSPWAGIYPETVLGEGCILWDCNLSVNITIGENVLINSKTVIGHDTEIGAHSVISAQCFLGGEVQADECVYLAPGALVKDRIHIGSRAIVSLGAVILRNVYTGAIMVGNPARRLGENTQNRVFKMFD